MSRGFCSNEQVAGCPLQVHFTDVHHFPYPANRYRSKVEKRWRELPFNKAILCRAVHDAIHASGYVPDKPPFVTMAQEIFDGAVTERSLNEIETQLALGNACLRTSPEGAA